MKVRAPEGKLPSTCHIKCFSWKYIQFMDVFWGRQERATRDRRWPSCSSGRGWLIPPTEGGWNDPPHLAVGRTCSRPDEGRSITPFAGAGRHRCTTAGNTRRRSVVRYARTARGAPHREALLKRLLRTPPPGTGFKRARVATAGRAPKGPLAAHRVPSPPVAGSTGDRHGPGSPTRSKSGRETRLLRFSYGVSPDPLHVLR